MDVGYDYERERAGTLHGASETDRLTLPPLYRIWTSGLGAYSAPILRASWLHVTGSGWLISLRTLKHCLAMLRNPYEYGSFLLDRLSTSGTSVLPLK